MVNDINTLNGSLSQLGETLANNLTAKGVSASASDGLTTLAGKILQISGGGGSTVIFEDACNSASGLSNYGTLVSLESSGTSANLTYDSTENAYAITSLSSGIKCFPITALNGEDNFKLSYEFRTPSTTNNYGLGLAPIIASTHTGLGLFVNKASSGRETVVHRDKNNAEQHWGNGQTITGYDTSKYYKLELVIDGDDATWNLYDGATLLRTYSYTLSDLSTDYNILSNRDYGITVGWNNSSSVKMYIKNIKAESLGGGSDCSQYTTQINNAITYINGDGS